MGNTSENKAKFFAQYWGQNVLHRKDGSYVSVCFLNPIKDRYLFLKPLSSITDEDAIEVGRIVFPNLTDTQLILVKDGVVNIFSSGWNIDGLRMLKIFDYLRWEGYALPWMGLSVGKQIEYGWVKLATS